MGGSPRSWASPSRVPHVTWRGRRRLCRCWGHSRTCSHSPHWGAALQSTRRMLQMQRLQKAVKNKQHFYFISFQRPPRADPCSSSSCSTSPLGSGYPSLLAFKAFKANHSLFLHPSQKQRTVTHEVLLPHRQTHHHLSKLFPPVLNLIWDLQPKQLFKSPHWQVRLDIDWT